ncbi:MAG: hypothetical protein PHF56_19005 [Desulfuromonadaceae bacterium]|nr:hypothetical protein [Desulfuromonadaceae bacterium]
MEVFGGFMVMMSIISLFLAVVWLIMPFVVFAIKGKQDRTLEVLETIEKRLAAIESAHLPVTPVPAHADQPGQIGPLHESTQEHQKEHTETQAEPDSGKPAPETSPAV